MGSLDPRHDIRELLSTRRARITPEEAGLPAYGGNRRVKGLRREEVAILAGVSVADEVAAAMLVLRRNADVR